MPTTNELLRDATLGQQIDLSQYSVGAGRRMVAVLNRADAALGARLLAALEQLPSSSFTVQRLEAMLTSIRGFNLQAYQQVVEALESELERFAVVEGGLQERLYRGAVPAEVLSRYQVVGVTSQQVYSAAMARPFQGRLLRDWAGKLAEDRLARVREAVRVGYLEGRTVQDIVRGLRGTREKGYLDGKLNRSRQELETVVRAAVQHHASVARDLFVEQNQDIVAQVVWSSTLDSKTSSICRIRDGKRYTAVGHKPVGHKIPYGAGPGKIHWNCRSSAQPVTKSWRELGFSFDELKSTTRASMDGQVPAELTYRTWLKKQPAYRQDEVLGPTRGRLLRDGRLDPGDLYSPSGRYLNLTELKQRYGAEFKRLGI